MAMGVTEAGPVEQILTGPDKWHGQLDVPWRFPPRKAIRTQFYSSERGSRFAIIAVDSRGRASYRYVSPWFRSLHSAVISARGWHGFWRRGVGYLV